MNRLSRRQVLGYLKQGKSVEEIARITKKKIPAIKNHVRVLTESGLWKPQDNGMQWQLDFNQATDLLIETVKRARQVPDLVNRISQLENQKAACDNEIKLLRAELDSRLDKERKYRLALQHGEIREPMKTE